MSRLPPPVPQWYMDKVRHDQKLLKKAGPPARISSAKGQNKKKVKVRKGWAPGMFQSIGAAVGGWSGIPLGSEIGRKAGQWFADVTGSGAYKVNSNTLLNQGNQIPMFKNNSGSTRIRHREFLTDISSYTNFTSVSYNINPGLQQTFPWLSSLAANYEQYKFHGLIFEFKSTSADALNSTNTALGTIILATEYDVLDSVFTNKQQMEAYEYSVSCKPSSTMIHPIECDPRQTTISELYVRTGVVSGADLRFHDLGKFQIAGVGSQAVAVVGELWVSYDIELFKPKIQTPLGSNLLQAHYTSLPVTGNFFANYSAGSPANTLGITFGPSANLFTFPANSPGRYVIQLVSEGGTITFTGGIAGTTGTLVNLYDGSTTSYNGAGSGSSCITITAVLDVPLSGCTVTCVTPTVTGAPNFDLLISQVSSGLT